MRIGAIVLAAGTSRRMGCDKMLLRLHGESLVRKATRAAIDAALDPVIVVTGRNRAEVEVELDGLPCMPVWNPQFGGPVSTSLHVGLHALPVDVPAAIILLADMIHVTAGTIAQVAAAACSSTAPVIASQYGDVLAPPLLFRRVLFDELLAERGDGCGKRVVERHRDEALVIPCPAAQLFDIDTPADWRSLEEEAGSRSA